MDENRYGDRPAKRGKQRVQGILPYPIFPIRPNCLVSALDRSALPGDAPPRPGGYPYVEIMDTSR